MYRIEVPGLPPSLNKFYSGMHYREMMKVRDDWHTRLWIAMVEAKLPRILQTPITVSVTQFCKGVVRDVDNTVIAAKFCLDTLKERGYIPDDNPRYVSKVILSSEKGTSEKTVLLIQAAEL